MSSFPALNRGFVKLMKNQMLYDNIRDFGSATLLDCPELLIEYLINTRRALRMDLDGPWELRFWIERRGILKVGVFGFVNQFIEEIFLKTVVDAREHGEAVRGCLVELRQFMIDKNLKQKK